jgi:hypothetical protein
MLVAPSSTRASSGVRTFRAATSAEAATCRRFEAGSCASFVATAWLKPFQNARSPASSLSTSNGKITSVVDSACDATGAPPVDAARFR